MRSASFVAHAISASLLILSNGSQVSAQSAAPPGPVVTTRSGQVLGVARGELRIFRGIPFAAPPVGNLRWELPQPIAPWPQQRDATEFGAPCPMPIGLGQGSKGEPGSVHGLGYDVWIARMEPGSSEDCLTLSIWAPPSKIENAPVMVFFSPSGSSSVPYFDGGAFARDGVVFVSPNNRMFTQAMFAHPALSAAGKPAGRFQEWDRIAALGGIALAAVAVLVLLLMPVHFIDPFHVVQEFLTSFTGIAICAMCAIALTAWLRTEDAW